MSADLFGNPGHNNIEISDVRRIVDKLDANLSHYEKSERSRRIQEVEEAARLKQHNDHLEVIRVNHIIIIMQRNLSRAHLCCT